MLAVNRFRPGRRCVWCGVSLTLATYTLDHIIPQWYVRMVNGDGRGEYVPVLNNTKPCCRRCNRDRGKAHGYYTQLLDLKPPIKESTKDKYLNQLEKMVMYRDWWVKKEMEVLGESFTSLLDLVSLAEEKLLQE